MTVRVCLLLLIVLATMPCSGRGAGPVPAATGPEARAVTRLYREILDREPDPAGLESWSEELRQGKSEAWLADVLRQSPEGRAVAARRRRRRLRRVLWICVAVLALAGLVVLARLRPAWLRRIGTGALILLVSLLIGEAFLRLAQRVRPLPFFYDDSYNRFRGRPHAPDWDFTLNSRGFKDVEFEIAKDHRYRIAAIGDSFAFGVVPYRHNYLTLLEELLNEERSGFEVINMGIASTGPPDYRDILVREALPLDPDLVLVTFFVGNDFLESAPRDEDERHWYEVTYVGSLIHYLLRVQPDYRGWEAHGDNTYRDDVPTFPVHTYLRIERDRAFIFLRGNQKFEKLCAEALAALEDMRDICRRRGCELRVAIVPDELQVNRELRREVLDTFFAAFPADAWDWQQPNRELVAALQDLAVPGLDLTPVFIRESRDAALYRPRDSHWNIPGNRLAAGVLAAWLQEDRAAYSRSSSTTTGK